VATVKEEEEEGLKVSFVRLRNSGGEEVLRLEGEEEVKKEEEKHEEQEDGESVFLM
jgi:hypothetical protein